LLQKKEFLLLLEDDIHFIHTKKSPRSSVTSTALHMCTTMIDVQEKIEAIPRTDSIHRNVRVAMKNGVFADCRGGVNVHDLMLFFERNGSFFKYFFSSYLEHCPIQYRCLDLSVARESCENLRFVWSMYLKIE